jgi:hypothetical protein
MTSDMVKIRHHDYISNGESYLQERIKPMKVERLGEP